jgi:hypothetical protein
MMYNFGNIVCWRADGTLDSFGRMDDQVKIKVRGSSFGKATANTDSLGFPSRVGWCHSRCGGKLFLLPPHAYTNTQKKFPDVTQATSLVIDGVLYGFYTATDSINEQDLDAFVRKHLPYYSVPARWIRLDTVPLNPNGKVDKARLKVLASEPSLITRQVSPTKSAHKRVDSAFDDLDLQRHVAVPSPVLSQDTSPPAERIKEFDLEKAERIKETDLEKAERIKEIDLEKGLLVRTSDVGSSNISDNVPATLPVVAGSKAESWLRHRALIAYRWFLLAIVAVNIGVACGIVYRKVKYEEYPLPSIADATAANLCVAVLIRSEPVINLLFIVCSSVPTWFPLRIRRICAQVYHIGGIHSGCAVAAVIWFMIFTVGASIELSKPAAIRILSLGPIIMSYVIMVLLLAMAFLSYPTIRAKHHNFWEGIHRFGGWTVLILYWVLVAISTKEMRGPSKTEAYLRNPSLWLIAVATLAIIFPWLFLRRVPVRSEVLSSHAVRLHFDYTNLSPGQGIRLAERPLDDWHGFATITNKQSPDQDPASAKGFSVIVSRAGDFTGRTIDTPPTHIWKRGIPTCGVLRIATLFKSIVLVATGSGIGPCLSIFPYQNIAIRILWTAANHEKTFGPGIVDDVLRRDPKAVLHNTRASGKPDMSLMAYQLYKESGAEAVLVISNKRFTTQIVYDMEMRGIPAHGAIFDS